MNAIQSSDDQEFIKHLHEEKLQAQETRNKLVLQKLAFGTGLLGLGTLNLQIGAINTSFAILLAPLVAIVIDFYIMGEDYGIKPIGSYLQSHASSRVETDWEKYVSAHRDPFSPWAMPILTALLTAGAGILAWTQITPVNPLYLIIWLASCILISIATFFWYWLLKIKIQPEGQEIGRKAGKNHSLHRTINKVRKVIQIEDSGLTDKSYREIKNLFEQVTTHIPYPDRKQYFTQEYGKLEFLACVDDTGAKKSTPNPVLDDFRHTSRQYPEINEWFHEQNTPEGKPILLPARWLCHALGLRHATIHLVLTTSDETGEYLVQVRSMQKTEAPGCFDLPVAGHVDGIQSYQETLHKEAGEELALDVGKLVQLEDLGGYSQSSLSNHGLILNEEYHRVYKARIGRKEIAALHPDPNEVAAILLLSPQELEKMMKSHSQQFASGITGTLKTLPSLTRK